MTVEVKTATSNSKGLAFIITVGNEDPASNDCTELSVFTTGRQRKLINVTELQRFAGHAQYS